MNVNDWIARAPHDYGKKGTKVTTALGSGKRGKVTVVRVQPPRR
jgi:hypothetical protein